MINYIWFFILLIGIVFGILTGRGDVISKAMIASSGDTVKFILGLTGSMCLWCGVMRIAQESGLTEKIAKLLRPILNLIFKKEGKDKNVMEAMVMNLTSNMMGLSNAATPWGIKAMEEMDKLNSEKGTASNDMAMFLVLNAACIQFLPTTVLSIRAACGSQNPAEIILPAIIATATAAFMGVIYCKVLQRFF